MNTRLLGLRNETEMSIQLSVTNGATNAVSVASGEEGTIEDVDGGATEGGIRSNTPAEVTESLELAKAARNGEEEQVALLLRRFAHPNSFDHAKGRTALHAACRFKHVKIVRMLLSASADVELPMSDGSMSRPLHLAAASGSVPIVRMLLAARAEPAAANAHGQNAAGVASEYRELQGLLYAQLSTRAQDSGSRFPSADLVLAASRGDYNRAIALLRAGADPNSTDASHGTSARVL